MDLRQKLLKLFGAKDYVPMRRMEIISVLKFDQDATKEAHTLLDKMLEQGEIARLKKIDSASPRMPTSSVVA